MELHLIGNLCIGQKFHRITGMQCVNAGDFFTYWKTRGGLVTTGLSKSQLQSKAKKGDIVQLKKDGSWYHSIIITSGTTGNWNYCGHTSNRKDKPISAITEATEYRILRFA